MTTYRLTSCKGDRTMKGTLATAIAAAKKMVAELQPAYGVSVDLGGCTVAEVDGERVVDQWGEPLDLAAVRS